MNTASLPALALLMALARSRPAAATTNHSSPGSSSAPAARQSSIPASCHLQAADSLPDPACSPGALNGDITPDPGVLGRTICKTGWTWTVRPDRQHSARLKGEVLRRYGISLSDGNLYELDHRIPLEVGGAPRDLADLWPEPWEQDSQHPQGIARPGSRGAVQGQDREPCQGSHLQRSHELQQGQQVFLGNWWQA